MEQSLFDLVKKFEIKGKVVEINPFGNGHINKTYHVITDEEEYILQQINNYAFKDVEALMNNIEMVTLYIKKKGYESLDIINTPDKKSYISAGTEYYRLFKYVKNSRSYESLDGDMSRAEKLGKAFGQFHLALSDLNPKFITETIPDFHNTPKRFLDFSSAYVASNVQKRAEAYHESEYILAHGKTYDKITRGIKRHEIRVHITHNDPKINNILFDNETNEVRCVVDLDTVMPGSVLYDIGDSFRSLFTGQYEDSRDTTLQRVNFDIFRHYMKAYLQEMKDYLTKTEIELIPYSIYIMTIEVAMRFLEDYFNGNVYFHVDYPEHNLIRCRTQIALAEDVLKNQDKLLKIVKDIIEELK